MDWAHVTIKHGRNESPEQHAGDTRGQALHARGYGDSATGNAAGDAISACLQEEPRNYVNFAGVCMYVWMNMSCETKKNNVCMCECECACIWLLI